MSIAAVHAFPDEFTGYNRKIFDDVCLQIGLQPTHVPIHCIFPTASGIWKITGPKDKTDPLRSRLGSPLGYFWNKYTPDIEAAENWIIDRNPNVVIALGPVAAWALLNQWGLKRLRGVPYKTFSTKVIPTYSPDSVRIDWGTRPIFLADIAKAYRESDSPDLTPVDLTVFVEPTLSDLPTIYDELKTSPLISVDIETRGNSITEIGFSPDTTRSYVIPFFDDRKPGNHYWPTLEAEREAWNFIREVARLPCRHVFQNGVFDVQFILRHIGIRFDCTADTMLLHHALYPELPKGLEFMATVHTDFPRWKYLRKHNARKPDA